VTQDKVRVALVAGHRYSERLAKAMVARLDCVDFVHAFVLHPKNAISYRGYESSLEVLGKAGVGVSLFNKVSEIDVEFVRRKQIDFTFVCGLRQVIPRDLVRALSSSHGTGGVPYGRDRGVVCFHPSDLPEGRGMSPVQWAIFDGHIKGVVSGFYIDFCGIDSGPIVLKMPYAISAGDDAEDLHRKIGDAVGEMYRDLLPSVVGRNVAFEPQRVSTPVHVKQQLDDAAAWIDLQGDSVAYVLAKVRAFSRPYGGAYALLGGRVVNVFKAEDAPEGQLKGDDLEDMKTSGRLYARCADGVVCFLEYVYLS